MRNLSPRIEDDRVVDNYFFKCQNQSIFNFMLRVKVQTNCLEAS